MKFSVGDLVYPISVLKGTVQKAEPGKIVRIQIRSKEGKREIEDRVFKTTEERDDQLAKLAIFWYGVEK